MGVDSAGALIAATVGCRNKEEFIDDAPIPPAKPISQVYLGLRFMGVLAAAEVDVPASRDAVGAPNWRSKDFRSGNPECDRVLGEAVDWVPGDAADGVAGEAIS